MIRALVIGAVTLLAACAHRGSPTRVNDFAVPAEQRVFVALREARARDEQRLAILSAYDESAPKLKALAERTEALLEQWRELERRNPAFQGQATVLAAEYAELSRARMHATAAFEARVAEVLDEAQWEAWQEFWARPAVGREAGGPGGVAGPGRGGRRR